MSKIEVDAVTQQSGTTLTVGGGSGKTLVADAATVTIGRCGGTVALASGASQTGFGREGSVDWQTSIKTGDFTAVSGEGYFINTTSGPVTMTLPSSPSAGDIVALKDYANTFDTHNLTIGRNGQPISGSAADGVISVEGQALTLVYGDATKGWQGVYAATEADLPKPSFVTATGGTITTVGNDKIHTFTSPGTFAISQISGVAANNQLSYLVVAGGGGSGGGGGGGGGFRENKSPVNPYTASPLEGSPDIAATIASFPITVGAGGAKKPTVPYPGPGNNGSPSVFSTITSAGGGGAGGFETPGNSGGSGGGATSGGCKTGGNGNTPPVSPPQGNPGGATSGGGSDAGGGGAGGSGGAGGGGGAPYPGGAGGAHINTSITNVDTEYSGGGGGGSSSSGAGGTGGGGGAQPGKSPSQSGGSGTANTGGGAGGDRSSPNCTSGQVGGSGIVVIRYKFQ